MGAGGAGSTNRSGGRLCHGAKAEKRAAEPEGQAPQERVVAGYGSGLQFNRQIWVRIMAALD